VNAVAVFAMAMAAGTYWGITYSERSRQIDNHIRRFLADIDGDRR